MHLFVKCNKNENGSEINKTLISILESINTVCLSLHWVRLSIFYKTDVMCDVSFEYIKTWCSNFAYFYVIIYSSQTFLTLIM